MNYNLSKIDEFFPFPKFRDGQRDCIEYVLNAFSSGKKFVIVEAPTGAGKSAIGLTVARFHQEAYYLTIQKILQTQIINDFIDSPSAEDTFLLPDREFMVDLKGRSNYPCTIFDRIGDRLVDGGAMKKSKLDKIRKYPPNCDDGLCRKKGDFRCVHCFKADPDNPKSFGSLTRLPDGMRYSACPYYEQVGRASRAHTCLMNFSSYLYQATMTTRFGSRELMVIDETHQLEPQLLDFVSVTVNDKTLQEVGFKLEKFDLPEEYWLYFVEKNLLEKIGALWEHSKEMENVKTQDECNRLYRKVRTFIGAMENQEEWVAEYTEDKGYRSVSLKPIFVRNKAHSLVFNNANLILMMSATILDSRVFCKSLGIPKKDVVTYKMLNRFPKESRPIRLRSAGKLTGGKSKMNEWGPAVVKKTDEIVSQYPTSRGIIHTHNFAIATMLIDKSEHRGRFLFQRNYPTKEKMLQDHESRKNSVIVAPAMHEGLDLRDDLSRFQIICKIPWPNYFDNKQLARRVAEDRRYYIWLTALKLVQSYGRSIRSEEDWADTYVLDGGFYSFVNDARTMLPDWFHEAIEEAIPV